MTGATKPPSPTMLRMRANISPGRVKYATQFASQLWGSNHPGWARQTRCGYGMGHGDGGTAFHLTDTGMGLLKAHASHLEAKGH